MSASGSNFRVEAVTLSCFLILWTERDLLFVPIYRGSRLNASKFMDDVHGELLPQFVHTYHSNWSDQKKTVLRNLE